MSDTLLHIPLFFGFALAAWLVTFGGITPNEAVSIGCLIGYLREVTQAQGKHDIDRWHIKWGWDFWNWSTQKQKETFVPIVVCKGVSLWVSSL